MPAFVNNYKEPEVNLELSLKGPDEYDFNFNVPIPASLETERIKLVPFLPVVHGEAFFQAASADPNLTRYIPLNLHTYDSLLYFNEGFIRSDPSCLLFAIIDKTKPNHDTDVKNSIAGMIGLLHHSPQNLSTEIGPVIIVPAYQRTFASSNAIGVLLRWCLDLPEEGGLGFRRVAWSANPNNAPSIKTAERMGFKKDGVLRWTWVLPEGKEGLPMKDSTRGSGEGRHSCILSICWDDWENGGRQRVTELINRQS
ncbi:hypothetical protein AX16_002715 [Volvariella volvacea WC 439]|nr:hypothetical protein AX16_002715 [Volvariella volvacea WC 439]